MPDKKENLVSCITCKKLISARGIFTHVLRSHGSSEEKAKFKNKCSTINRTEVEKQNFIKMLQKNKLYYEKPNYCANCSDELDWFRRFNKFCSHSCSASLTNTKREEKSAETKEKIRLKIKENYIKNKDVFLVNFVGPPSSQEKPVVSLATETNTKNKKKPKILACGEYCAIYHCTCKYCAASFIKKTAIQICDSCKLKLGKLYVDYRFKFNVYDYPELFDLSKIDLYGWYAPKGKAGGWNPTGLSRDHRVSVSEAIKNKYDSFIIAHPLNCELMPHSENSKKKGNSSISYAELVILVKNYELEKNKSPMLLTTQSN